MTLPVYNMSLRNLEYRLRAFQEQLPDLLEQSVRDNEATIIDAVRNSQLFHRGIDGAGRKIMDYEPYSPRTIANKRRKGQPTTRVTLRDSGAFYSGFRIEYQLDGFAVTSDDRKTEMLINKYGPRIMRLTNENLNRILRVHIRRDLTRKVRNIIREAKV